MKSSTSSLRILLTGSTGFLGQHILKALLNGDLHYDSLHVVALYGSKGDGLRDACAPFLPQSDANTTPCVRLVTESLDLSNSAAITTFFEQHTERFDVCIHAAAISSPRHCQEDPDKARSVNNPVAFLEALEMHNAEMTLVAISTDQVYGGDEPPYHDSGDGVSPKNVYAESKVSLEQTCLRLFPHTAIILRSSIILGPRAPLIPAHDTFVHFIAGRDQQATTFFTDERRSVVFVADVVSSILYFLKTHNNLGGVYNMGGPESKSRMEMAEQVFAFLKFDKTFLIPAEKAHQPPGPVESPLDISMDSTKLYEVTGIKFKSLQQALPYIFPTEGEQ